MKITNIMRSRSMIGSTDLEEDMVTSVKDTAAWTEDATKPRSLDFDSVSLDSSGACSIDNFENPLKVRTRTTSDSCDSDDSGGASQLRMAVTGAGRSSSPGFFKSPRLENLFKSQRLFDDETRSPLAQPLKPWIVHPESTVKRIQDILLITVLVIYGIALPYRWAFDQPPQGLGLLFDMWCEPLLVLDVVMRFRTAFYELEDGAFIDDPGGIARSYMKKGALLDLSSAIPVELMNKVLMLSADVDPGAYPSRKFWLVWVIVVRLNQLSRVVRVYVHLEYIQDAVHMILEVVASMFNKNINFATARLIKLFLTVGMLAHWCGCLWYRIGTQTGGWVETYGITDKDSWHQYTASYYYVFTTITTVGYGDLCPQTPNERLFVIVLMFLGCTMFAFVIGLVGGHESGFDRFNVEVMACSDYLDALMKEYRIPGRVQRDVRVFFDHYQLHTELHAKENILPCMPYKMRRDLTCLLYKGLGIRTKSFVMKGGGIDFTYAVLNRLKPSMVGSDLTPVCVRGELAADLYFLHRGNVDIVFEYPVETVSAFKMSESMGSCTTTNAVETTQMSIDKVHHSHSFGNECLVGHALPGPRYLFTAIASANSELFYIGGDVLTEVFEMFGEEFERAAPEVDAHMGRLYETLATCASTLGTISRALEGGREKVDVPAHAEYIRLFNRPGTGTSTGGRGAAEPRADTGGGPLAGSEQAASVSYPEAESFDR